MRGPTCALDDLGEVCDLDRSSALDHQHNSLTTSIALIATHLEVWDLGRMAQVCKTWRRASLSKAVWWDFARRMGLTPQPGDDCRALVIPMVVGSAPSFFRTPHRVRPLGTLHENNNTVKVVLVSPDLKPEQSGVGKTSLILRRIQSNFVDNYYDPTIEDSYRQNEEIDGEKVMFDILDTSGQNDFVSMQETWFRGCEALVKCSLFSQEGTIDVVETMYEACCQLHNGAKVPLVLVRTKSDLRLPFVEAARVFKWAELHGAAFVNTSALTGINEREPFFIAARLALSRPTPRAGDD